MSAIAIDMLSKAERLALIGELWDSLEAADVPISPRQTEELDNRLATIDADIRAGKTWDQIEAALTQRRD